MTRALSLVGGTVLTPFRTIPEATVVIRDRRIAAVGKGPPPEGEVVDARGSYVVPGFVDLHLHGGGGHDVMEGSPDALAAISLAHVRGGTTSFLATTLTAPWDEIEGALGAVEEAMEEGLPGAELLGAHLEGPYLSPVQAGAQDPEYLEEPDPKRIRTLLEAYPSIRRISLAPELPGALECARLASEQGVLVSVAHSDATYQQVISAVESGFRHVTHLYSGCSTVCRISAYRIAGVVEAALVLDWLTTELIADGHHLPPSLIKLVLRAKGANKVCVVTDAMAAAGLGPGRYRLGKREVIVEPGGVPSGYEAIPPGCVARLPDGSAFAGSAALMIELVENLVQNVGIGLAEAVRMASATPAAILGLRDRGVLAPGYRADIVVFTPGFEVLLTVVGGKIAYKKTT